MRILTAALPAAALLALAPFAAAPALAQDAPEEKVNQVIVFGDDACPASTDGSITVCARKPESERYRIPEVLRDTASPQNDAWNNKVLAYETVGAAGTSSCSPTGAGGWTGCSQKLLKQAAAEKAADPSLKFGQLIAEERAKRLATIDQSAADEQARVEAEEKAYFERQQAEKAAQAGEK